MEESPDNSHTGLSITYTLKSGAKVDRWYFLPITRDRMAQPGTYDHLLDQFVNSEAMKARRLHLDDGFWTVAGGSLFLSIRDQYYDLGSRRPLPSWRPWAVTWRPETGHLRLVRLGQRRRLRPGAEPVLRRSRR